MTQEQQNQVKQIEKNHNPDGLLRFVKGDASQPQGSNLRHIVQIVNDKGVYGAGFSGALSRRWPKIETEYRGWWRARYGKLQLGEIQSIQVLSDLVVINMVAQKGTVSKDNPTPIKYDALKECLKKVAKEISGYNAAVHMPRIGCGLAGGTWDKVEPIIKETLINNGINVTVYDLEEGDD